MAVASPDPAAGRSPVRKLLALGGFALLGAAVVKELRLPARKRHWNGRIGPFPYDLRPPTLDRVRERMWNPKGSLLSPHVFGVGWTVNLGRLAALVKAHR
jgi:uncharacterized protein DUF5808